MDIYGSGNIPELAREVNKRANMPEISKKCLEQAHDWVAVLQEIGILQYFSIRGKTQGASNSITEVEHLLRAGIKDGKFGNEARELLDRVSGLWKMTVSETFASFDVTEEIEAQEQLAIKALANSIVKCECK